MRDLLRDEADAFFEALAAPAVTGLRVNTLKLEPARLQALTGWDLSPIPWCPSGFIVAGSEPVRPGKHPYHAAGLYYLQEPSAMAVAEAVAPLPGERVADLAAAPGGKSTHLVSLGADEALLVANDVKGNRLRLLTQQLERWGATQTVAVMERIEKLASKWGAIFDRVLLDAPCSGEGMFRKAPESMTQWREASVLGAARRQQKLLSEAARLVKPGGRLVYSTCTFAPEENEQVVATFLADAGDFRLVDPQLADTLPGRPDWVPDAVRRPELGLTRRIWPHLSLGEGHFIAALERTAGSSEALAEARFRRLDPHTARNWRQLAGQTFATDPARGRQLTMFGDKLFAVPEHVPELRGLRATRCGLWLATNGKRLKPSHALAMAAKTEQVRQHIEFEPGDEGLQRFLLGDVLDADGEDGWVLVTVSGFPLGWGRLARGVVKNALPKGLRIAPS